MLETSRCILRPFEEKDLDSFMTYRNNEEWMQYQSFKNLTKDEYRKALLPKFKECYSDCEIVAMIEKENTPSKNLLHKLRFVYDGWIDKWQSEIYVYSN